MCVLCVCLFPPRGLAREFFGGKQRLGPTQFFISQDGMCFGESKFPLCPRTGQKPKKQTQRRYCQLKIKQDETQPTGESRFFRKQSMTGFLLIPT